MGHLWLSMKKEDMKSSVIHAITCLLENFSDEERLEILYCIPFCIFCGKYDSESNCNCGNETHLSA